MEQTFNRLKWRRLNIILASLVISFVAVVIKLAYLQIFEGNALAMKAEKQHRQMLNIEGGRGNIYDMERRELAVNLDMPSLYGIPSSIDKPQQVAKKISGELNVDPDFLQRRLNNDKHFVWIKRRIQPEIVRKIKAMNLK